MMNHVICRCGSPDCFDITDWLTAIKDVDHSSTQPTTSLVLLRNMMQFGWSPVRVRVATRPLFVDSSGWKAKAVKLFQKNGDDVNSTSCLSPSLFPSSLQGVLRFHTSESGDPHFVEPKQSWEFIPAGAPSYNDDHHADKSSIERWSQALKAVADATLRILGLPRKLLSHDDEDTSCVDILRVFYYDVLLPEDSSSTNVMGSSPHTDWGSFTVVYQDDVGGLQTFCRKCQAWVDVRPPSPSNTEYVEFVVHVGDMTSLAIGHALIRQSAGGGKQAQDIDVREVSSSVERQGPLFPSPLHRVLSPAKERRVSLVYFAYPSPEVTLRDIIQALLSWEYLPTLPYDGASLSYENYYLLRNQQSDEEQHPPSEQFARIIQQPIRDVLKEKWRQVQRD